MAKKQTRKTVSINRALFVRFATFCTEHGLPRTQVVELLLDLYLADPILFVPASLGAQIGRGRTLTTEKDLDAWWAKQKAQRAAKKALDAAEAALAVRATK